MLCDFTVNPSALHAADLMGLCSNSAERGCSFSFNKEQRRDCISPDKINLVEQQSPYVRYIKLHSLKYLDSSV